MAEAATEIIGVVIIEAATEIIEAVIVKIIIKIIKMIIMKTHSRLRIAILRRKNSLKFLVCKKEPCKNEVLFL